MQWLVSLGLLVAVLGWLLALHHRLHRLHEELEQAWALWVRRTRRRNACLVLFLRGLEQEGRRDLLPAARDLAALAERSDARLTEDGTSDGSSSGTARPEAEELSREEEMFSRTLDTAVSGLQDRGALAGHDRLLDGCAQLCLAMQRQEQSRQLYNACADAYNEALRGTSARLAAPSLRFFPATRL